MEILEQMADLNKNASKSFYGFNKFLNDMTKRYTEESYKMVNGFIDKAMKHSTQLSEVKKVDDFLKLQEKFLSETSTEFMNSSQKLFTTSVETFTEFSGVMGDFVKEFSSHGLNKNIFRESKEKTK